ncbi:hypothetical protein HDU88_001868 [Geranomyces variabilis]|nr:hypothetical protein HDU88_001868 [Geranomyces variabilis]
MIERLPILGVTHIQSALSALREGEGITGPKKPSALDDPKRQAKALKVPKSEQAVCPKDETESPLHPDSDMSTASPAHASIIPQFSPSDVSVSLPSVTPDTQERLGLKDLDTTKYAAFGSIFILAVDSSLFPLDTVKTVIMSQRGSPFHTPGIFATFRTLFRAEGLSRFWRGLPPAVAGSFPGQALYYVAYETAQDACADSPAIAANPFLRGFLAGAAAEITAGLCYVPADVVAQRLQVQNAVGFAHNKRLYSGPIDLIRKVIKIEGPRGFYRGYMAYVGAYAPASAVQWGTYEHSKPFLSALLPTSPHLSNAICGGLAGLMAVTSNNPLEVLRVRQQLLDKSSAVDAEIMRRGYMCLARTMWRTEGIRGFYKGLQLRILVTVPGAMIAMSGYESIKCYAAA